MENTNSLELIEKSKGLIVTNNTECATAGDYASGLQKLKKKIVEYFKPLKADALKSHKGLVAKEKGELDPIDTELSRVKGLINGFLREQQRLADEQRLAEFKAQRERENQARIEAEMLKDAEQAKVKEAEADEIALEVVPEIKPEKVKLSTGSMATVTEYTVTIHDEIKLLQALIDGDIPLESVNFSLNQREIKRYLKETGHVKISGLNISITQKVRIG